MFVGGVAAVLLELGEARVRHGVWDHSSFARDPIGRLNRTGNAAMVTAFAPVAEVERMTSRVNAWHERIAGKTPDGMPYRAGDPELLRWVQTTAAWSFLAAWERLGGRATPAERDSYYNDGVAGARLFGVTDPCGVRAEADALLADWTSRLTPLTDPTPTAHHPARRANPAAPVTSAAARRPAAGGGPAAAVGARPLGTGPLGRSGRGGGRVACAVPCGRTRGVAGHARGAGASPGGLGRVRLPHRHVAHEASVVSAGEPPSLRRDRAEGVGQAVHFHLGEVSEHVGSDAVTVAGVADP